MTTTVDEKPVTGVDRARDDRRGVGIGPVPVLSALRSVVGAGTWASPALSGRTFGLGSLEGPGAALLARLFGVRDLALGQAIRHPSPEVRRAALQVGVLCDSVGVVASLVALRRGAARSSGVLVGGGAAFFVALGLLALADQRGGAGQA